MGCKSTKSSEIREGPYHPRGPQAPPYQQHRADEADRCSVDPHAPYDPVAVQRRDHPQMYAGVTPRSRSSSRMSSAKNTPVRGGAAAPPYDQSQLSPHDSDAELVLICVDCGCEIMDVVSGDVCRVTGKLHR